MNHKSQLFTAAAGGLQLGNGLCRIVCLAALLFVFATSARAYDLWVGGVKVTTSNASDKGWKVKKFDSDGQTLDYASLGDVNGDNKIDQTDLDTIVKIIMGLVNLGYSAT